MGEGRERLLALEDGAHVGELLIQVAKDRENECSIKDRFAQIAKRICHGNELVEVV
jgi:hypothetical protein